MNKSKKVLWYYSKSQKKMVNLFEVDPNHARNALVKIIEKMADNEGLSLDEYLLH
jgi:hypothetical protein